MAESIFKAALRLGYIDEVQKAKAEKYKMETGLSEDSVIRDTKIISDEAIVKLYSDVYHIPIGEIKEIKDTSLMQRLNPKDMHRLFFFPVKEKEDIVIYTSLPSNLLYAEDLLKETFGFKGSFIHKLISLKGLNTYIAKVFEGTGEVLEDFDIEGEDILNNSVYDIAEEDSSAVVNLINKILRDAISKKTSDVHFEPQSDELVIRFREDGTLYEYMKLPLSVSRQVLNRIKTMSALDVNISKTIQDGNCRLEIFGKTVDLRISVIPAVNGENIVIRILDQNKMSLDISMLGFSKENEELFKKLIRRPQGMILLTGPTGSGKSTSLYAAVSELNTKDRCIITFEDPVEYRVPGIVQVQINHSMNVTFPQALKSGLRQDIEVALVGEIRDEETASIAFDAANTGHMVFSTLHTNSAASSIIRLTKMGIEPYIISRSLVAVINQRLVKRICENCKEEYFLEENSPYRKILGCGSHPMTMFRGKGCSECNGTGYKGRVSSIVNECNIELSSELEAIEDANPHDRVELEGEPADWNLVLSLFSVKVAGKNDNTVEDVVVIDEAKKQKLKDVFWDMHTITSRTETVSSGDSTETVLYITITTKTKDEMIDEYGFSNKQKEALETLLENASGFLGSTQSLAISDATAQEALDTLSDSLSDGRKKVVKHACSLVGKVTYFWGGKSSAIGWDSNWGKMKRVTAEGSRSTGTIRPFGLDCSGFVTWAFINAGYTVSQIGHGAATQASKGTRISWSSVKPGDLALYNDNSHIGIIAGKDSSGNVLVIHCASGANNVVITGKSGFGYAVRPNFY